MTISTPERDEIWNAALEAAADLIGTRGYAYVRRPFDPATMTTKFEILVGDGLPTGEHDEFCHCSPEPMTAAAILSLRRHLTDNEKSTP